MPQDAWLSCHPYLRPVAELHAIINVALADVPSMVGAEFPWDRYLDDFDRGVPLLHSTAAEETLVLAEGMIELPLTTLISSLRGKLAGEADASLGETHRGMHSSRRVVEWLIGGGESVRPGTLRFLGWTILSRQLQHLVGTFAEWRDEERWFRPYCPTCGSPPAMAQLVGTDPGRRRLLVCGCCKTHWQYRRTKCPFCEGPDDHRLSILAVEGELGLRIDYCESCRGYLKTYDGEGFESVLLADWTSIHLDIVAINRGLRRRAGSLYEL
jgi:FdhE protein